MCQSMDTYAELTPDQEVPILVLDVSEDEADRILLTLDPLAAMAETDSERTKVLIENGLYQQSRDRRPHFFVDERNNDSVG